MQNEFSEKWSIATLLLSIRIARHQAFAFPRQVQQAGSAFEYLQIAVLQVRYLAKRLTSQMFGLATLESDCLNRVANPASSHAYLSRQACKTLK